ncbi:MAG: tRNA lysidine(34) synthetase TilS, partial [Acidimicrobiia bacterium]|nr:tRNA lysidine(34) synthetase TilS [Acidimicrobiia bacterium]
AGADRLAHLRSTVLERVRPVLETVGPDPIVVGLSGGADSAICAWALVELRGSDNLSTCYVDHGWAASTDLGVAAAAIATRLGIRHRRVAISTDKKQSEAGAREARYGALFELAGAWVATGHTRDDQAETLLLHLMRGTGLDGMAAMHPIRGNLVRPLLAVGRSETRELAELLKLDYVDDPSNTDLSLERNRVRSILQHLDPSSVVVRNLARSSDIVREDLTLMSELADQVAFVERGRRVGLPAPALTSLPAAIGRRLIRRALRQVRGPYAGTAAEVERVMACVAGEVGSQELAGGVTVHRAGPWLWFSPVDHVPEPAITIEVVENEVRPLFFPSGHWRAVFDGTATAGMSVRPLERDDVIELGAGGHKPVSEVLAEAGIGALDREDWPLLEVGGRIAWVPGCRTAPWSWVRDTSTSYRYASAHIQE